MGGRPEGGDRDGQGSRTDPRGTRQGDGPTGPAIGNNNALADLADKVQAKAEPENSSATRSSLVEGANRLAEALQRLREGHYGICEECWTRGGIGVR